MQQHISYSQVSQYLRCGLAYRFKYVDHLDPEFTPSALIFGSSFHAAVELFFHARMEGDSDPTLDELHTAFCSAWWGFSKDAAELRFKENEDEQSQSDLAGRMLKVFLEHFKERELEILAVERHFSVDLAPGLPPLLGYLDLIERTPNGEICITDIKTAARKYPEGSAFDSLQLAAYAALAKALGHQDVVQVKYVVVTKAKSPAVQELVAVLDDPDVHRFMKIAQGVHQGAQRGVFVPNPGWQCGGCQWQGFCRVELGRAV